MALLAMRTILHTLNDLKNRILNWGPYYERPVHGYQGSSPRSPSRHLALVVGPFSTDKSKCTFGDTEALKVALSWLAENEIAYDVCRSRSNGGDGRVLRSFDPACYSLVVFVGGPWLEGHNYLLGRFRKCLKIGLNLSVEDGTSSSFDFLLARDSASGCMPDLSFATTTRRVPLVGVALVHPQPEYGIRQRHRRVNDIVTEFMKNDDYAVVSLDTLCLRNPANLRTTVQFENLLRRLDFVITSRLHGLVFALKNKVPAIVVDCVAGGAKVTRQAEIVGWPLVFNGDTLTLEDLNEGARRCLGGEFDKTLIEVKDGVHARLRDGESRLASFLKTVH